MLRLKVYKDEGEYNPKHEHKKRNQLRKKSSSGFGKRRLNQNKWTAEQNTKFLNFVEINKKMMDCPEQRKKLKVFLQLSRAVKTRSAAQCRSHHQKMIKNHFSLEGIIAHLKQRLFGIGPESQSEQEIEMEAQEIQKHVIEEDMVVSEKIFDFPLYEQDPSEDSLWKVFNHEIWMDNFILSEKESFNQEEQ